MNVEPKNKWLDISILRKSFVKRVEKKQFRTVDHKVVQKSNRKRKAFVEELEMNVTKEKNRIIIDKCSIQGDPISIPSLLNQKKKTVWLSLDVIWYLRSKFKINLRYQKSNRFVQSETEMKTKTNGKTKINQIRFFHLTLY